MVKVIGIGSHFHSTLDQRKLPDGFVPKVFLKTDYGIISDGGKIEIPPTAEKVKAEVEIAVRLNQRLRNVSPPEVTKLNCIDGFAVCGDLTAKGSQVSGLGKLYDGFTPCSNFVNLPLNAETEIEAFQNGVQMQKAKLSDMGMNIEECIAYYSKILTLEKGDILLTGTPAGAFEIHHGDFLEFKSTQIGTVSVIVA